MRGSLYVLLAAVALGCGGGGGDGGTGPQTLTSVTVTPNTADLFTAPPGTTQQFAVAAKDQNGRAITTGLTTAWSSDDPTIVTIDPSSGIATQVAKGGPVTIHATVTQGSTSKDGTASVTVDDAPATADVNTPNLSFSPGKVDIKAGGTVTWHLRASGTSHNVEMDTQGAPFSSSGTPSADQDFTSPAFNTPGTYNYHCAVHGSAMTGTVVVH